MVNVTAPGLGLDQNAQMDYSPMQCYDRKKSYKRVGMGGTGCKRPPFPILSTTNLECLARPTSSEDWSH